MIEMTMKNYQVRKLLLENGLQENESVQLSFSHRSSFAISEQNDECRLIAELKIVPQEGEKKLDIQIEAEFFWDISCEQNEKKELRSDEMMKKLHVQMFSEAFPFLRMFIANAMTLAGLPPLMIPVIKLKEEEIGSKKED